MLYAKKNPYDFHYGGGDFGSKYALDTDGGYKDSKGDGCDWYDVNYKN